MSSLHSPSPTRRSAPSRRGRALAAVALAAAVVPLAAGCGAGFTAETQNIKPNSGNGIVGVFRINNVWVVADAKTGNAEVIAAVANTGSSAGTLTGVQVSGHSAAVASPVASPLAPHPASYSSQVVIGANQVDIGPQFSVSFGQPGSPELELHGAHLKLGSLVNVTFSFADGGSGQIVAQVVANSGLWATYNPNAGNSPSPKASPSASASASASASSSASSSASASASASVSPSASAS